MLIKFDQQAFCQVLQLGTPQIHTLISIPCSYEHVINSILRQSLLDGKTGFIAPTFNSQHHLVGCLWTNHAFSNLNYRRKKWGAPQMHQSSRAPPPWVRSDTIEQWKLPTVNPSWAALCMMGSLRHSSDSHLDRQGHTGVWVHRSVPNFFPKYQ